MKSEAYYKDKGYNYIYIRCADEYKNQFDGFEIIGPWNG